MSTFEEILKIKKYKEKKFGVVFESYEEFLERNIIPEYKRVKLKCFVRGCSNPGYYEGGDSRYRCGMCEEHAGMKSRYILEMKSLLGFNIL